MEDMSINFSSDIKNLPPRLKIQQIFAFPEYQKNRDIINGFKNLIREFWPQENDLNRNNHIEQLLKIFLTFNDQILKGSPLKGIEVLGTTIFYHYVKKQGVYLSLKEVLSFFRISPSMYFSCKTTLITILWEEKCKKAPKLRWGKIWNQLFEQEINPLDMKNRANQLLIDRNIYHLNLEDKMEFMQKMDGWYYKFSPVLGCTSKILTATVFYMAQQYFIKVKNVIEKQDQLSLNKISRYFHVDWHSLDNALNKIKKLSVSQE